MTKSENFVFNIDTESILIKFMMIEIEKLTDSNSDQLKPNKTNTVDSN